MDLDVPNKFREMRVKSTTETYTRLNKGETRMSHQPINSKPKLIMNNRNIFEVVTRLTPGIHATQADSPSHTSKGTATR